jgi:muramoyltetrapeptide carboxypeptidase
MRFPARLSPGDTVAVVAPSSPFDASLASIGLRWLSQRYRLKLDSGLFARSGYLAGDDARRREELARAMSDPEVRAIIAVRGGYGLSRFAHELDWGSFTREPRWIVGFSDVTALHVEAARVGIASLHGPHVTGLCRIGEAGRDAFFRALEHPTEERLHSNLDVITPGVAEGPLYGGNLALLQACAAAGRLAVPDGAVLLLEDVTERPYRVDRMLATLEVGGHLRRVAAVVAGEFTGCDPGPDGVRVEAVLRERLGRLGVPAVMRAPIGHGERNEAVVLGGRARVTAPAGASAVGGELRCSGTA